MTYMAALNLRTEFEEITKDFQMPEGSGIDTIEWFIENGHRSNSLRNGFAMALKIAQTIKEYSDECAKETGAWQPV